MRKLSLLTGAAFTLLVAGATIAATPTPSPSPSPSTTPAPTKTPAPSTTPSGTSSRSTAAAAVNGPWTASIAPLDVTTGTATVAQARDGSGTITLKLSGLAPNAAWTVDVDAGTLARALEASGDEIAFRAGREVDRTSGTVRIRLTAAEMKHFLADRTATGVVVLVSDGTNRSAAVFAKA